MALLMFAGADPILYRTIRHRHILQINYIAESNSPHHSHGARDGLSHATFSYAAFSFSSANYLLSSCSLESFLQE